MDGKTLQAQIGLNAYVLARNIDGVTHEESLAQPSPGGNCANWILGHLVRTRNNFLPVLGKESPYPRERFDAYEINPITDRSQAIRWEELVKMYADTTGPITEGLAAVTPETMAKPAPFSPGGNPDETIGSLLVAFAFHESYHSGQLALTRRLTGKAGVIKSPEAAASR